MVWGWGVILLVRCKILAVAERNLDSQERQLHSRKRRSLRERPARLACECGRACSNGAQLSSIQQDGVVQAARTGQRHNRGLRKATLVSEWKFSRVGVSGNLNLEGETNDSRVEASGNECGGVEKVCLRRVC